ncbi:Core-2/I-Branching enzyme [Paramixta manurensis]|uniref:Peptide O-xylosyltransferase n=1 Tax=Paramixta manurensis TaxID=2740817 RepID=A0A6M8UAF1_9GAMM|nr:Core-2/I-Branching enzyme [Erwiniaceae bacterium PD-1]
MKVAYLIQCHKNSRQIELLINSLILTKDDYVVIHIDAKSPRIAEELKEIYQLASNIHIVEDPVSVFWSGISQLQATLKMLRALYHNDINFDYCCLLSGEDVVLDVDKFKQYLCYADNKSFLDYRSDRASYCWRINRFNLFRNNRFSQTFLARACSALAIKLQFMVGLKRKNFRDEEIFLGSQWFTLSRVHADIIYEKVDDAVIKDFTYTSCSDEHFFQMLFSQWIKKEEIETFNLRYIDFPHGHSSPRYLSLNDLLLVRERPACFIARKVTSDVLSQYISFCEKR